MASRRCADTTVRTAARATLTLPALLPPGRPRAGDQAALAHRQSARAAANGVSRPTQRRLDKLARRQPDLLVRVAAGEISLPDALFGVRTGGSVAELNLGQHGAPQDRAEAWTAGRIQAAADVHAVAQHLDDVARAAHADLGTIAVRIHAEDWALAHDVEHVRTQLVVLHDRLVALTEVAQAIIERARLREREDSEP
ncbi:MAG TPA: hypothetical protein VHE30_11115 [Polyangiaceae bacterium]|nr:hypothetical protein [Polyangiaceae bacterium]